MHAHSEQSKDFKPYRNGFCKDYREIRGVMQNLLAFAIGRHPTIRAPGPQVEDATDYLEGQISQESH